MTDSLAHDSGTELRASAIDELVGQGWLTSERVAAVMRAVPRHRFAPEAPLSEAYHPYNAVVTKRDEDGIAVSSVSAPQIQAMMLEQAGVEEGMRVLEVGSGGLNAAYLAELVGASGEVTTVDIDPDVTRRAEKLLAENGYGRVRVVLADAERGVPQHAPYDRILVTVGAWDIPPAWIEQLTPTGRLVVPLRVQGLTRSIAFDRTGGHLESTSTRVCGFVSMRGAGEHQDQLLIVDGTDAAVRLRFDEGLPDQPALLDNALRTPRAEAWSGVTIPRGTVENTFQLYLATALDGFCTLSVDPDRDTGPVAPRNKRFSMATVQGPDFAYITPRPTPDEQAFEYGVHAFGPGADLLAEAVVRHLRDWDRDQRGGPGPRFTVHPAGTPVPEHAGAPHRTVDKIHSRVTISWPRP
ncbi:methyltransferase, FxLD system [Streptomyces sp. XM4011]|uniref:methyltransferase, FxLD system n=1 Tax=Streptomyces sp. XM4011 TaxID=2929780 RepID=UPI001FF97A04|nr:methyltransferase, FxLD system [Streptomyces sp. XM4011]MCK1812730.1 methyltransferase, FxLD system [Streptomyces sp. XM4011]